MKALPSDRLQQLPEDSSNKKGESAQDSLDARLLQAGLLLQPPLTASQPPPTQPPSSRPSQRRLKSHVLSLAHKDGPGFVADTPCGGDSAYCVPSEWMSRASTQTQTESEVSASLPAPSALIPGFSAAAGAGRGAEEGRE